MKRFIFSKAILVRIQQSQELLSRRYDIAFNGFSAGIFH